jgi:hypothetical protein
MTDKMPVGEWIEIKNYVVRDNPIWSKCKFKFIGNSLAILEKENGDEFYIQWRGIEWRYTENPVRKLREKMLDDWRGQGVDYAYDDDHSVACIGQYFDWLIKNGYIEVK